MSGCRDSFHQVVSTLPPHLKERCRWKEPATLSENSNGAPSPIAAEDATSDRTLPTLKSESHSAQAPVVYWTHHALRTDENPALDVAKSIAEATHAPLLVYFGLNETYRFASDRHHWFILQGMMDLARQYDAIGIRFVAHVQRNSYRTPALRDLVKMASILVTEDFPGEPTEEWTNRLAQTGHTPVLLVDTACVVPTRLVGRAYDRAFAFRDATRALYKKRIDSEWPESLSNAASYQGDLPFTPLALEDVRLESLIAECEIDHSIGPVTDTAGGSQAGYSRWNRFQSKAIRKYAKQRNDPTSHVASRMSAYLHYGMVSPMRLAREAYRLDAEKYLDELLIWRELAYAYCHYRSNYATLETLPDWAIDTLRKHASDARESLPSWEELARGKTGDRFWDLCQSSLLLHGELNNNVRMTWGKAIVTWTATPEDALQMLIDLNHRYALDGRDPASYGGILWCMGQFDRPFYPEQPVLGTVRPRALAEHAKRVNLETYHSIVHRPLHQKSNRIAIVGAGIGGLMCARILADHGCDVTIFEKSRGVGGRMSTRTRDSASFDHGAQYFTSSDARLKHLMASWQQQGILEEWQGRIVELQEEGMADEKSPRSRWVGVPGMTSLAKHIAKGIPLVLSERVTGVHAFEEGYHLTTEKGARSQSQEGRAKSTDHSSAETDPLPQSPSVSQSGPFQIVLFNMPAPQILPLLPAGCDWLDAAQKVEFDPCWALLLELEERWDLPLDGAFINNSPVRWIARNNSKAAQAHRSGQTTESDCWVIHSDFSWAQENLHANQENVAQMLLESLQQRTRIPLPTIRNQQLHRWLYARCSRNETRSNCYWDASSRLGACGDWFQRPNVEGALLSGMAMAGRVLGTLAEYEFSIPDLEQVDAPEPTQLRLF